ncbi:MAG: 1-(5-phosphoribosyl)-5-[(5-phosphoribosylamino)methylideneamino]imidazole-4-carboxamide isomerase [Bacteroidales bacterium]|nr:1-(5-phosphoribosyl)-5-[(5-phosphoribosylamino)methylideneamino]imidazole-4-carboxamide isomerase [Bacteroidales bacterium]
MIEIIPAIDIIDGKCVRLSQGDYERKTIYNEDPLEVARMFEDHGIRRLHVVDLDGAKAHHIINYKTLERLATKTQLIIDFGGGLKSDDDLRIAFECGAKMITGGSIAVKQPEIFLSWIEKYGSEHIILGADVKNKKISVGGWLEDTGEELLPFVRNYKGKGIDKVICTDISRDGMLTGPSIGLYTEILEDMEDLYLIASGGVSSMQDIERLQEAGIPAVIFGKAIYEGKISLNDLTKFIVNA